MNKCYFCHAVANEEEAKEWHCAGCNHHVCADCDVGAMGHGHDVYAHRDDEDLDDDLDR